MKLVHLKIKIKSLADEARIIRAEEHKLKIGGFGPDENRHPKDVSRLAEYNETREHRVNGLRKEARASLLAYAYLRGKPYRSVEPHTHYSTDRFTLWYLSSHIAELVISFSPKPESEIEVEGDKPSLLRSLFGKTKPQPKIDPKRKNRERLHEVRTQINQWVKVGIEQNTAVAAE